MKNFGLIGGDRRQAELARLLRQDGHRVLTFGVELWQGSGASLAEAAAAEIIVLPVPLAVRDGVLNFTGETISTETLFDLLKPGQVILAGQIKEQQRQEAAERSLRLIDYLEREELAEANAIPTAEGAVQIALERLPVTLCGSRVAVLGFGRIGRQLTRLLLGFGARVAVAARRPESRIQAESWGCEAFSTEEIERKLPEIQVIFNTIPALLLKRRQLECLPKSCLCIDLASTDGLDFAAADTLGLQALRARGLPGKTAPVTAAMAIRKTIYHILEGES